ncbi:MAG: S10 family peptidase [Verrucomicrobiales bacterium]|nr:peptidase S10 [Verrucomicrobiota bacterium JB025]
MIRFTRSLAAVLIVCAPICAAEKKDDPPESAAAAKAPKKGAEAKRDTPDPVSKTASVTIDGETVSYTATAGSLDLKKSDGKENASIFHVSYVRNDVENPQDRPVMFAFNGGPGSSAVWLHLGVLGPKIIDLPGDGTQAPKPPVRLVDNPLSILDACDLVFIDPVSTGYSRAGKDVNASQFHGLNGDISSVGDFIRRWVSENKRWASPKFLLGESYGGIRVAGLSEHLQTRYGMSLNGVVLLSSLLDFATLSAAPGNDLPYLSFLQSYTGTAHFHGKIKGDREALMKEAADFAFGDYAAALLKGSDLDPASAQAIATKLESLTGVSAELWLRNDLRLDSSVFRKELLRDQNKVIGRFDGRVAWSSAYESAAQATYDPSYSLAYGAFATAMLDYLSRDLGYPEDQPYEILTGKVRPWRWDSENKIVNVGDRLATAMRDNPNLKVLVMAGKTDLATPPQGITYSLRHLPGLPEPAHQNISTVWYDGGHMFYLNPPDLRKTRTDLLDFLRSCQDDG